MKEKLKNELLRLLDKNISIDVIRRIEPMIDMILSNYEVEERKTEVIPYGSDIPGTVETYIVSKKISGLSNKSLYLYNIVLTDFFRTVQKKPEKNNSERYSCVSVFISEKSQYLEQNFGL